MADFVAVLKKTLEGLGDATPEMREKVYAKARGTISAKLNAINPPPPQSVVDRQVKALDEAIALVEAEYAAPPPPPPPAVPEPQPEPRPEPPPAQARVEEDLETILASLQSDPTRRPVEPDGITPAATGPARPVAAASPVPSSQPSSYAHPAPPIDIAGPRPPKPAPAIDPAGDGEAPPRSPRAVAARPRLAAPVLIGLVLAVIVAGAGYALWINRDDLGMTAGDAPQGTTIVLSGDEEGADAPEEETAAEQPPEEPAPEAPEVAAVEPPAAQPEPAAPAAPDGDTPQKFTQRLLQDGSEVDPGPAGEEAGVGEGTSVATAVIPAEPAPPAAAQPDAPAESPPAAAPAETPAEPAAAQPDQPALPVGQRAIFYEERTSSAQGSAETGSIVWSMAQESPGGDLPPEPAIRAEATIPGKDLQLRMTIRRNADQTLPASHIVEMIFLTPETFEGGGIENVLRMTMKDAEEAPGNALLGIPAKIADGFFLIALSDGEREVAQNTALMSRDQWIDIPIVYRSGRRALITMEKGIPGGRVFEEAIKAWQAARSG